MSRPKKPAGEKLVRFAATVREGDYQYLLALSLNEFLGCRGTELFKGGERVGASHGLRLLIDNHKGQAK